MVIDEVVAVDGWVGAEEVGNIRRGSIWRVVKKRWWKEEVSKEEEIIMRRGGKGSYGDLCGRGGSRSRRCSNYAS